MFCPTTRPRIALRLIVIAGFALCGVDVDAAEAGSDPADPVIERQPGESGAAKRDAPIATPPDATESPRTPRISESRPVPLQEVAVTGSRLTPAEAQSAQDVRIYERERIEKSGQTTVSDFLATLPEVSLISPDNTTLATQVRLRGAIFGSALILINGRRTDVTGGAATVGIFDLGTIPISLVERIEVLPTGSSAIYGGDALAGVVNIVLRSNFTGAEAGIGYKSAKNTHERLAWAGGGWKTGDFSLTIMASYGDRSPLYAKNRDITASPDLRRFGGPNLGIQSYGVPANVSSVSGNLPGLNSSFATVPRGSSGVGLTPSDFAATAGTQNTGSYTSYSTVVTELHQRGVFLSANYTVGSTLELFAELLATNYKLDYVNFPPFLQLTNVPASNPFNPFGATVRVSGVVQGAEGLVPSSFEEDYARPLVGARGKIGTWDWELTALNARDSGSWVTRGNANTAALNAALASSNPQTALNPFKDGPMASPSVLASIYSNPTIFDFKADATIVDAFARGPLLNLPAGPLNAVVGAEYQKSGLERSPEGIDANRNVRAAFTELRVPVFASKDERGEKREVLALQGAARYDNYSDFGSKTTWQAAFELRPVERVLLRGTHSTAFKPPTLYNIAAPVTSSPTIVSDPRRNGETVVVQAFTGGNSGLRPTTGTSSTLGFVWSPAQVRDLNLSMTRWWMSIEDAINFPSNTQFIVDNDALFPGRVIRAPAAPGTVGQITGLDRTYVNFGEIQQSGIDGAIDWRVRTGLGVFTPAVAATYMTKFEGASVAGAPSVDRLSRANNDQVFAPRWKGIASIGWAPTPAYNVWLAGRYIGSYTDYTPPREIGNIWYLDASVEVNIERAFELTKGSLGGMKLSVSGTNLTDKLPDWSTFVRGYDVLNYDILGRTIFVRLKFQL